MVLFSNIAVNTLNQALLITRQVQGFHILTKFVSSKLNDVISVQFSPTWVHWNMVQNENQNNDIFLIGSMLSLSFTKVHQLIFEYFNRINTNNFDDQNYQNLFTWFRY